MNDELKMGKGKIAAQCGHGVAGIFTKYRKKQQLAFQQWDMRGGAKIALKVPSTKELVSLRVVELINKDIVLSSAMCRLALTLWQVQCRLLLPCGHAAALHACRFSWQLQRRTAA